MGFLRTGAGISLLESQGLGFTSSNTWTKIRRLPHQAPLQFRKLPLLLLFNLLLNHHPHLKRQLPNLSLGGSRSTYPIGKDLKRTDIKSLLFAHTLKNKLLRSYGLLPPLSTILIPINGNKSKGL